MRLYLMERAKDASRAAPPARDRNWRFLRGRVRMAELLPRYGHTAETKRQAVPGSGSPALLTERPRIRRVHGPPGRQRKWPKRARQPSGAEPGTVSTSPESPVVSALQRGGSCEPSRTYERPGNGISATGTRFGASQEACAGAPPGSGAAHTRSRQSVLAASRLR